MINKIKIGDKDYLVIASGTLYDDSDRLGLIDYKEVKIKIAKDLEPQTLKEILCHEAIHGMLHFMGEHDINNNEESVERITNGLLMLIKDNPKLFKAGD